MKKNITFVLCIALSMAICACACSANTRSGEKTLYAQGLGAAYAAAASIYSASKTFVNSNVTENAIYLYVYENGCPVMLHVIAGEGGAATATGTFILDQSASLNSAEEVRTFLADNCYYLSDVSVKEAEKQ